MATNYIITGEVIDTTAPAALVSGEAFAIGAEIRVALKAAASGAKVPAARKGVFRLPKLGTAVIADGAKLTWDISEGEFIVASPAAGDIVSGAIAVEVAGDGTTTVLAALSPEAGSVHAPE